MIFKINIPIGSNKVHRKALIDLLKTSLNLYFSAIVLFLFNMTYLMNDINMKIIPKLIAQITKPKNTIGKFENLKEASPGFVWKRIILIKSKPKNLAAENKPLKIKNGTDINMPHKAEKTKYPIGPNTAVNAPIVF
ncbi:hypothetical protein PT315_02485 [Metamycoplasma hyosynoviae]|nr:hypothetical protein [Metamycoplasma hyosynoviae]MDC8920998.1 hypothetical protein [Metamycoplasma hyosynoviae]MDD1359523.1 hypothetical protein [Metamycoplasma hyosynoviae]MDD1360860.1 hypothetical protein [Metamycoplasma hyosynoviae]MDD1361929.1 hypothetical protein [Metamycoplasma hyosynoviae]MDD1372353.1 hypothetical protein [Metamycoplasma hyosynoviae]